MPLVSGDLSGSSEVQEHVCVGLTLCSNIVTCLHVCTVHQQYQGTFLLFQTDVHSYKIIGILKQLNLRLSLQHVSVHAGTIFRELFCA
jgi:hypothetical protein